ncbi:TlpA family protein disulfide reductase [Paenibacillus sp. SYP-B3998]|uniref:TlpA family protein disulfide reductase n=1 Tax=Paenibacillus sp. SYP-B3998 TaxID=2678564 RepID=A0A6G3ZT44_9BACL|nr:TlpA disulfide reductase family protein [Paenibacillus sp. SYP-B3998]NEW04874.1 TlpA family protein disulfide reductase [Paenibacillus sp. SYP-B3998]
MFRKKIAIMISIIILGVVAVTIFNNVQSKDTMDLVIPLKDLGGNEERIIFRDKPTAILFFTSWCPYCKEDAPKIVSVYEKYKNEINLYGVNLINRDDRDEVDKYVHKYKIGYPILLDEDSILYKKYGSPGFPTLVFFDKNGKETKRIVGSTDQNIIDAQFRRSLINF